MKIKPINVSVKALSHTPQYKMHKYFARRPYNVFSNLVDHYTSEGDIILDPFCGGGVTVYEGCNLKRNVIGVDLNPLAAFITRMQMFTGNVDELKQTINKFISDNVEPLRKIYNFSDGNSDWIEWAYIVKCPECGSDIVLTEDNKIKNGFYKCPNEKCTCHNGIARTKCFSNGEKPIRTKIFKAGKSSVYRFNDSDVDYILNKEAEYLTKNNELIYPKFEFPMNWDRQKEDKLFEKGIRNYKDLYSSRNLYALSNIFKEVLNEKKNGNKFADYLYFIFSSTLRYTNKMSKVTENWEGGNPTCMDKHAYYLPNSFIENNVVNVFIDRANSIIKGCAFSKTNLPGDVNEVNSFDFTKETNNYWVINGSSDSLPLEDECVDIVITDPPYGSNVQYAELSVVWNAWYQLYANKDNYIYREKEAVSNRKSNYDGAKTELDYGNLLYGIYKEAYRVLKPESYMVFTFNNKNVNVWLAMLKAVAKAGFILAEDGVLFQDFIASYKNTSHLKYEGNVQGDFIYSFVKTSNPVIESFDGLCVEDVIEKSIIDVKAKISVNESLTSEELYKRLFSILASNLMKFISYKNSIKEEINYLDFEERSIDKHLDKYFSSNGEGWIIKGDKVNE